MKQKSFSSEKLLKKVKNTANRAKLKIRIKNLLKEIKKLQMTSLNTQDITIYLNQKVKKI